MGATHLAAERRYDQLRQLAIELAQENAKPGVRFETISPQALAIADTWDSAPDRRVLWYWEGGYEVFKFRYPKRFEVALWEKGELTGLSLGRPTYASGSLRLDFIEARPGSRGEKTPVFPEIEAAYMIYAKLLNAKQIRIMKPINEAVRSYYARFGYEYLRQGNYLFREVV